MFVPMVPVRGVQMAVVDVVHMVAVPHRGCPQPVVVVVGVVAAAMSCALPRLILDRGLVVDRRDRGAPAPDQRRRAPAATAKPAEREYDDRRARARRRRSTT